MRTVSLTRLNLDKLALRLPVNDELNVVSIALPKIEELGARTCVELFLQDFRDDIILEQCTVQGSLFVKFLGANTGEMGYKSGAVKMDLRTLNDALSQIFVKRLEQENDVRCFENGDPFLDCHDRDPDVTRNLRHIQNLSDS